MQSWGWIFLLYRFIRLRQHAEEIAWYHLWTHVPNEYTANVEAILFVTNIFINLSSMHNKNQCTENQEAPLKWDVQSQVRQWRQEQDRVLISNLLVVPLHSPQNLNSQTDWDDVKLTMLCAGDLFLPLCLRFLSNPVTPQQPTQEWEFCTSIVI